MRLLHLDQDDTPICRNFAGKAIPPYAILSHRWGSDEVLYEDIVNRTYQSKPDGYKKIAFCARQVAQDGLAYFWIDSCCIAKSNRRERSRAISSMFAWYKAAVKCYVYLSDVSAPTEEDAKDRTGWETSFRESDWHTRGWTLQELIAPSSVDFFSMEGQRLGTRVDLVQILAEITSIPLPVIHGGSLATFSIDDWKEWGKDRKTKEPEDRVYCLLGILDVYLPLSYGEGEVKAMQRLRKARQDPSMLSTIPFSRNDSFVGRESELADLEAMLVEGTQTRRVGIVGEGGTGKTQLMLELAYRMRKTDRSLATFWIDAGDTDSFQLGYTSIAQTLDIAGWEDEGADAAQLVKAQLEREDKIRWLLVLDNVESIVFGSRRLVDYLPQSISGTVIFTSTERDAAEMLGADAVVELREMTESAARELITASLPELDSGAQREEMPQLLSELGYLPLAIAQAAAYIKSKTGTTAHAYRQQLTAQQRQLDRSDHDDDGQRGDSCGDPVVTTLMVSLELLQRERPLAADCLAIAACVDRKDILLDLLDLLETASPLRDQAVESLREFGLITRRPADDSFDVHRLVHQALRQWLRDANALDRWIQKTTARLVRMFPDSSPGNRGKWRRLLPHTRYVLESGRDSVDDEHSGGSRMRRTSSQQHDAGIEEGAQSKLMWRCADALYYDGRWQEAEELQVRVMETRKTILGTLTSIANLASIYMSQGRWQEAEDLQMRVIETRKRVLGDDHPNTLSSIANLASVYRNQGRWQEAEELEVRVMETRKRVLGDDHPNTLNSINNLASTYMSQGRWQEAEDLQIRVIEIGKRVLGDDHPNTLSSIANLASTYCNQGRWLEAEELEVRVMETRKRVLGDDHPNTLNSMNNLAITYTNQGRWQEAEELGMRVIETKKRVLGDDHPNTLNSINNLVSTYMSQGRWQEAEELGMQVIETMKRVLGDNHPDTLISLSNLAFIWRSTGRETEALTLMTKCARLFRQTLGNDHPNTRTAIDTLISWTLG